jgi:hypothetical protein
VLCKNISLSIKHLIVLSIVLRALLFFSLPNLSDDFYRFLWDGELQHVAINPYAQTPTEVMEDSDSNMNAAIFQKLNSPAYRTVYPPLSQLIFSASTAFGGSILFKTNVLRLIILLFEIGVIVVLSKLLQKNKNVLLAAYALNPLVILELTGNLHFEGIVLFFVLLFIWLSGTNRWIAAALSLGLGIAAKLTPLMFLPLLIKRNGFLKAILQGFVILTFCLLVTLPFLDSALIEGMSASLSLFFKNFEFNGGLFFLLRGIGFWLNGYDPVHTIGPIMSVTAMLLILTYSWWKYAPNKDALPKALLFIWAIQLLFATTVHPWYVIPMIGLAVLTGYVFPIVWSCSIFFSYLGYDATGYDHPFAFITIEYVMVFAVAGFELIKNKPLMYQYLASND